MYLENRRGGSALLDQASCGVGYIERGATEAAAELGALGREHAPGALPTGHDPVVQHPHVRERDLRTPAGRAVRGAGALGADNEPGACDAQPAVEGVLVPQVVGTGE